MEKKLADFRKQKERDRFIQETKTKIKDLFKRPSRKKLQEQKNSDMSESDDAEKLLPEPEKEELEVVQPDDPSTYSAKPRTYIDYLYYSLCFVAWASLYAVFIKWEFGMVYLVLSALIGMYINTRTSPRKPNEASAYSVFNKNCESIDGTLKAEQFERELIYGPASVR